MKPQMLLVNIPIVKSESVREFKPKLRGIHDHFVNNQIETNSRKMSPKVS